MRKIAIAVCHRVYLLSVASITDPLQIANRFIGNRVGHGAAVCESGTAQVSVQLLSVDGNAVTTSCGITLPVHGSLRDHQERFDLVCVPALEYADAKTFARTVTQWREITPWLQRQHAAGALLAANGSGVFALAEAGLLDHRDATIVRLLEKVFHRRYPAVRLQSRSAITEADGIFCAATLPAMVPLMQHLLERFTSPMIAHQTRRALQLDEMRAEPQLEAAGGRAQGDEIIAKAQYWMQHNLAGKASLGELAHYAAVSERTLIRHFKQVLGVTPHAYLQTLRMETAKRFLERTDLHIDTVAERVGYSNTAFFSRSFRTSTGITPTEYRRKMRTQ